MYRCVLIRFILLTASLLLSTSTDVFASGCTYTSLPVTSNYTDQGFIWYKQSDYQEPTSIGYWQGFSSSFVGIRASMSRPTNSGCGPISMATIVTNCKQQAITPKDTIQYYCNTGLYTGNGSSHSSGVEAAKHYGLSYDTPNTVVSINRIDDMDKEVSWMRDHLEKGHWIQILVKGKPNIKNSIWSHAGGHFVAIHGYQDGNTFLYDSSRLDLLEAPVDLEEVWMNIRSPYSDNCKYNRHITAIW